MSANSPAARWAALLAVKNQMGRYTRALLHKEESTILQRFWSRREDICLGLNEGWYLGRESIGRYYDHLEEKTRESDRAMKTLFPGLEPDARGIGYLEMKSLSTDLVEVAGDGESARAMWNCAGQKVEYTAAGPVTFLTYGTFAVDFIREEGEFRIWNLQYLEDISHPQGEKWWEEVRERPSMEAFEALAAMAPPAPDVPQRLYEAYSTGRHMPRLPALPEPYETLGETATYGMDGEVWV